MLCGRHIGIQVVNRHRRGLDTCQPVEACSTRMLGGCCGSSTTHQLMFRNYVTPFYHCMLKGVCQTIQVHDMIMVCIVTAPSHSVV